MLNFGLYLMYFICLWCFKTFIGFLITFYTLKRKQYRTAMVRVDRVGCSPLRNFKKI